MAENLGNDFATTLNGSITDVQTAITVTSGTGAPAANFRIRIDDELMLVTSTGAGTNWTVTRGIEGTSNVAHADLADVAHVVTKGGLDQYLAENQVALDGSNAMTGSLSIGTGAVTADDPILDLSQTWNNAAVAFTGFKQNITNTASLTGSKHFDWQVGGTSIFWHEYNSTYGYRLAHRNAQGYQVYFGSLDNALNTFSFRDNANTEKIRFNIHPGNERIWFSSNYLGLRMNVLPGISLYAPDDNTVRIWNETGAAYRDLEARDITSSDQVIVGTTLELGHATDTTLARAGAGDVSVEGNIMYRAGGTDVPIADGGTGASDAATARTNLGLGSIATQNANAVAITGGTINGVTIGGTTPGNGTFNGLYFSTTDWAEAFRANYFGNCQTIPDSGYAGGSTDLNWKKIATVTISSTGLYTAAAFRVRYTDAVTNYGASASAVIHEFIVSCRRSGGVLDNLNDAVVYGPASGYVRVEVVQVGSGGGQSYIAEIQGVQKGNYRHWKIEIEEISSLSEAVVYQDDLTTNATGTGTMYTPTPSSAGNTVGFGNLLVGANVNTNTLDLGGATDATLARVGAGDVSVEGNLIYRAGGTDVPITDGGTGASTADAAINNLMNGATATTDSWDYNYLFIQDQDAIPPVGRKISSANFMKVINLLPTTAPATGDLIPFYDITGFVAGKATIASINGQIDHGTVTGLADDDHTQYLLTDGSRIITGSLKPTTGIYQVGDSTHLWAGLWMSNNGPVYWGTGSAKIAANTTTNLMQFYINSASELSLDGTNLFPTTNQGLTLGKSGNGFNHLWLGNADRIYWNTGTESIDANTVTHLMGFRVNSGYELYLSASALYPATTGNNDLGTSTNLWNAAYLTTIQLGHATDTTISRVAAGRAAIEGVGVVRGPASATDNAIARFDATTGDLIQSSGASVSDSGYITAEYFTSSGTLAGFQSNDRSAVGSVILWRGADIVGLYDTDKAANFFEYYALTDLGAFRLKSLGINQASPTTAANKTYLHIGDGDTTTVNDEAHTLWQSGNAAGGARTFDAFTSASDFAWHLDDTGGGPGGVRLNYQNGGASGLAWYPGSNNTQDLGIASSYEWRDLHLGGSVSKGITQASHGLAVGNLIRYTGSAYAKAQADSAANAEVVGMVTYVPDANNFSFTAGGHVDGLSGLTAGTTYFLDPSTAGAMTATEPSTAGQVSKPVFIATSTTSGIFANMRGVAISDATYSIFDRVTGTATAGQTALSGFSITPGLETVIVNGATLDPTDYTVNSATSITLDTGMSAGDNWQVVGWTVSDVVPNSGTIQGPTTVTFNTGTSYTFTGIPNGVKRVTIHARDCSQSDATNNSYLGIQLGTSGGLATTGYDSFISFTSSISGLSYGSSSTYAYLSWGGAAANTCSGSVTLELIDAVNDVWVIRGQGSSQAANSYVHNSHSDIDLSGPLTQIKVYWTQGYTADAGTLAITYEF